MKEAKDITEYFRKAEYLRLVQNIENNEFCDMCIEQEAYELDRSCTDCPIKSKIKKNENQ